MQLEPLDIKRDGDAFYRLYLAYINELNGLLRIYGNPAVAPQPWWVDDPDSLVQVAHTGGQLAGFVINGWRSRVDKDTDSEILELYVASQFRRQGLGRRLAHLGLDQLSGRAGLQVYLDNTPAQAFWPLILAAAGIAYTILPAIDQNIPVIKFRFFSRPSLS
jgi:ribosomal protein S18 acetylase RimI-like enzyme